MIDISNMTVKELQDLGSTIDAEIRKRKDEKWKQDAKDFATAVINFISKYPYAGWDGEFEDPDSGYTNDINIFDLFDHHSVQNIINNLRP